MPCRSSSANSENFNLAHTLSSLKLLTVSQVDEQIRHWTGTRNGKQTLEIIKRGFNRKFYFNPGLWRIP